MNHTTQEPKSMQLAVELEYRREYEAAHELRTMQARIDELEAQLYTTTQPTENLNCKSNQKRLATLWGYVKQDLAHKPLTNEQIIEIADKTKTAEPGTDGYILPISFARAIEAFHTITGDQQ